MHCEAAAGKQSTVESKRNAEMIACLPNALYACMSCSIDFVDLMRIFCCGALRLGW
jgi:hypothetical protein